MIPPVLYMMSYAVLSCSLRTNNINLVCMLLSSSPPGIVYTFLTSLDYVWNGITKIFSNVWTTYSS